MRYNSLKMGIGSGMVLMGLVAGVVTVESAQPEQAAPAAPAAAATSAADALEKQREKIRTQLNGSRWELELRSGQDSKPRKDTMTFEGRTVASEWLSKQGYGSSNYSLRIENDGLAVWETMQVSSDQDRAFWRGELRGDVMQGALSVQPIKGGAQDYSFSATRQGSAPAAPAAHQAAAPAPAAPSAVPDAPPKKKRGWLW